jgi:rod shape determining protein RodA
MTYVAGVPIKFIVYFILTIFLSGVFLVLPLWQMIIKNNAYPALMMLTDSRFVAACCLAFTLIGLLALFGIFRYGKRYFFWICYGAGILIPALAVPFIGQKILRPYQLMRLVVFIDPNIDPRGSGWHIIQSITAIGSGGVIGKGYLQGTHSHYQYLPEQSTDFIFSILSEEWGFVGGIIVFMLFLLIILRLIRIINQSNDTFGSYIVAGLVSMIAFHFIINVGMTMGIMPITGIPLLFLSYGGSALVTSMIGIGFALSIHIRRFSR